MTEGKDVDGRGRFSAAEVIGDKEGRLDICIASAGVWGGDIPSLEVPESQFQHVSSLDAPSAGAPVLTRRAVCGRRPQGRAVRRASCGSPDAEVRDAWEHYPRREYRGIRRLRG